MKIVKSGMNPLHSSPYPNRSKRILIGWLKQAKADGYRMAPIPLEYT